MKLLFSIAASVQQGGKNVTPQQIENAKANGATAVVDDGHVCQGCA